MPRQRSGLDMTAETLGAALGHVAAKIDAWRKDRTAIAADIQRVLNSANAMLGDLSETASSSFQMVRNKGGRPKGYKMSAATKAKLRAAWKRRKAASANIKTSAGAAKPGAKALVKGKPKGSRDGAVANA